MTETLIPNLAVLPALVRGGAATATRDDAAESFASQFERSRAAATDVATDLLPVPDQDVATHDLVKHALLTQRLAPRDFATRGLAPRDLATRGLAPHDLAPHDLATHDLATHDLATHDLATHDLASHDRTTHDAPTHDLATHDAAPHDASPDALSEFLTHWPGCAAPSAAPAAAIATQATASAAPPGDTAAPALTVSAPASPTRFAPATLPRGAEAPIAARDSGIASTLAGSRSATPGVDRAVRNAGTESATRERVDLGPTRREPAPTGDELNTTAASIAGVASGADSAPGREPAQAAPERSATAVAPDTGLANQPVASTPAAAATAPLAAQAAALETAPSNQQTSPIAQLAPSRPAASGGAALANNERHHAPLPTPAVAGSTRDAGSADSGGAPPMDESVPASRPHGARTGSMLAVAAGSAPDRHESPAPFAGSSPATTEPPATARPSLAEMAPVPGANLSTSTPMQATGNAPPPIFSSMAAPVPADMSTPVPSPQFADALGVQVSVLARAGIERAELQLNPASMGPLAVQITLDAGHAQVHFGSDSAQTRQIVEAGFPALAAALRDAGFTLSGGGVSQHPGDPRHQGAAARGATNFGLRLGTASPDDEVRPLRTTRASLGRLDLYA